MFLICNHNCGLPPIIQSALLNAANTAEGRAMLEKLGRKDGFVATDKDEYGAVIELFGL